ncbi:hypothetical protein A3762_03115 [Oleiphilus sp. HI0125]|uniref:alpha/beta hydrolase n=1 Tax=Oleiphilus sp. HI0125 TaxID=1822266 RepID=UPI0007C36533|nr:alpha/beta hydrolase [Oleiphilus sp. HI0125]KZZ60562.1 hypothetical protein A3762_03115 [Oleiphilus sp. HI0125]
MLKNSFAVLGASSSAFSSMVVRPNSLSARSWRAEFTCRFVQMLFNKYESQSHDWLRETQKLLAMKGPALSKVTAHRAEIAGVPVLEVYPKKLDPKDLPTVVYFHGGGYVIGSAEGYKYTLAKIAILCGMRVIAVDYRLAPEHPLPCAQEDCLGVVESIIKDLDAQEQLYLMGDSAGGALVLNTLRELKEQGRVGAVDGAVLLSPWVRPFEPEYLSTEFESVDMLSESIVNRWVNSFGDNVQDHKRVTDFSETSFIGFPPMYVQAGGSEIFKAQVDDLVSRLRADRVNTAYDVFPDMFHVFQTLSPLVPEADRALALIAKKIEQFT